MEGGRKQKNDPSESGASSSLPLEIIEHILRHVPSDVLFDLWRHVPQLVPRNGIAYRTRVLPMIRQRNWNYLWRWMSAHKTFRVWYNNGTKSITVNMSDRLMVDKTYVQFHVQDPDDDNVCTYVYIHCVYGQTSIYMHVSIDTLTDELDEWGGRAAKEVARYDITIERIVYWHWMGWIDVRGSLQATLIE